MRTLSCDSGFYEPEECQEYPVPDRILSSSFPSQDSFSTFQATLDRMEEEGEKEMNEDFSLDFLLGSSRLVEGVDHLENLESKPGNLTEMCETSDCDITYCDSTRFSPSPSSPIHYSIRSSSPLIFPFHSTPSSTSTGFTPLLPCTPPYSPLSSSPCSSLSLDSWSGEEWRSEGGWKDTEWKGEIRDYDWTDRKDPLQVKELNFLKPQ